MTPPSILSRLVILCVLLAASAATGCFSAQEGGAPPAVHVPRPLLGEAGTLADGSVAIEARFTGVMAFRHVAGAPVDGVAMKTRAIRAEGASASAVHLIDERGHLPLVVAECAALGAGFPQDDDACQDTGAWSGSYLASRLPGAFGAAPFWGRTLTEGAITVEFAVLGAARPTEYQVAITPEGCARLTLRDAGLGFRSQYVYSATGIPETILLCPDAALPHLVTIPRWGTFMLQSHERGSGEALEARGIGADPSGDPAVSNARPVVPPLPWQDRYDPANLSVPEAHDALRTHPGARDWLIANPDAVLVSSSIVSTGGGNALPGRPQAGEAGSAQREMWYRGADGAVLSALVQKNWNALTQKTTVVEWGNARDGAALDRTPERAVPQAHLLARANETLGTAEGQTTVTMFLPNGGVRWGLGDRYFLFVRQPVPGSLMPLSVAYDTTTGHLLAFTLWANEAEALTGLSSHDLRR